MVQFFALFNTLSSRQGKSNKPSCVVSKTAHDLAKEAKKKQLLLTSCGVIRAQKSENYTVAYSKGGKKGINQDRFIVWEEFGFQKDMVFCGVFDGHGPWGHLVSKYVRQLMPSLLLSSWQETAAINAHNPYHCQNDHTQFDLWKQSYYKTCAAVDRELEHHPRLDSFYSGTTALALVRQGNLMMVANVGDSRAVLATTSDDGNLVSTKLTTDLKPNLPCEHKRIAQSRGRIYSCPDEPGVQRVWMPSSGQSVKGPGLAVSRAFGDYFIKGFGLISEPEITLRYITSRDQFVILATDGVWDVITNEEAVEIVYSTPERSESAKRLVERAVSAWKQKGKANVMDDISVICQDMNKRRNVNMFKKETRHRYCRSAVQINKKNSSMEFLLRDCVVRVFPTRNRAPGPVARVTPESADPFGTTNHLWHDENATWTHMLMSKRCLLTHKPLKDLLVGTPIMYSSNMHKLQRVKMEEVAGYEVQRVFIDAGSSLDVLFYDCFKKIEFEVDLKKVNTTLYGFNGGEVIPWAKCSSNTSKEVDKSKPENERGYMHPNEKMVEVKPIEGICFLKDPGFRTLVGLRDPFVMMNELTGIEATIIEHRLNIDPKVDQMRKWCQVKVDPMRKWCRWYASADDDTGVQRESQGFIFRLFSLCYQTNDAQLSTMVAEIGNYGSLVDGVQERERKRKQAEVEVRRELEDRERRERERDDGEKHEMGCDRDWELNFCREGDPAERRTGDRERDTFCSCKCLETPGDIVVYNIDWIVENPLL
ncbi:protein phosphatase 2C family protein [Striga asiatica]|uniref:Protein phosphatase 2C family protein n=1 Tax=Striga asiatica TaxID=4170 RepID=A0A5A7NYQ7_STRAF|nr:protein phosphatase 2C family protein [Striga asiatica]